MDTTSGNRAINRFMGQHTSLGEEKEYGFSYHVSWSELMPVVEHIESLGFASVIEKYPWQKSVIHRVWFTSLEGKQQEVAGARDEKKITAVWLAVVAFIEWYNEKK